MRFTKFFRRYSRTLLMVFMSLLLVAFLLGDVIQNISRSRSNPKEKIGQSVYGDIYTTDWQAARADQDLLMQMGFQDAQYVQLPNRQVFALDALDMHLLMQEAERMGVRIGRDQVKATLAQMDAVDRVEQRLAAVQKYTRRNTDSIYDTIGKWLAVEEVIYSQVRALDQSVPRAEMAYRDTSQKADVEVSVIDARGLVGGIPDPTEEELQAFFDAAKDRFPGHTEDKLEFGYRLPDRVRVEYVTIDPKRLANQVHVRERDVEKYYQENKANYTRTVAADTQSTTRPTQTTVQMTFEEAKERARQDYRNARAVQEAQSLMNQIHDQVYRPWQSQTVDAQGFRPLPEGGVVSLAALRDQYADRAEIIYQQTTLLSQEDLQKLLDTRPDLLKKAQPGGSREPVYVEGANEIPLSTLAFRIQGLYTPKSNDRLPVLGLFEPSPVLTSRMTIPAMAGSRQPQQVPDQPYIFRVVQVEPSGPPASLDEVREQVRSDYKLAKAYELAGQYARQLADAARTDGLTAAADQATELKQILQNAEKGWQPGAEFATPPQYSKEFGPLTPLQAVTRSSTTVGQYLTDTQKVPREIFAAGGNSASATGPAHNVVVADVAKLFRWAVVEVKGLKPIYQGEFEQQEARLIGVNRLLFLDFQAAWMEPTNVRARSGFIQAANLRGPIGEP